MAAGRHLGFDRTDTDSISEYIL